MNPDEKYRPPSESLGSRRCSKRVTRSDTKSGKRIGEKPSGKSTTKPKGRPPKKSKSSPDSKQTSPFSSSPLTPEELQQLYEKFSRDGHFSLKPPASPAPLVVSRTTDGKVVTTKIECYKRKRYLMRELAATMTSSKADDDELSHLTGNDPSDVIFSTPLHDKPAKTVGSNSDCAPFLPAEDIRNSTKNHSQRQDRTAAELQYRTSVQTAGLADRLHENSRIFDTLSKPSYTLSNSQPNVGTPSSCSAFSSVTTTRAKSLCPTSSTWNSSEQASSYHVKRNCSTTSSFHFPDCNASQNRYNGNVAARFGNDSNNCSYENLCSHSLPTIDNRDNSDAALFDSLNSAYPVNNQSSTGNSSNDWNSAGQIRSDTFAAYNSKTMSSNPMTAVPSNIIAYNSEVMSVNNSMYTIPTNKSDLIGNNGSASEYRSTSFMSWNGVKVLPNNYSSVSDSSYGNMYGTQNSAGTYNAPEFFNDSRSQTHSWLGNQQMNKDCFLANDAGGNDSSAHSSNLPGQDIASLPVITNLDDDLKMTDGEQPAKGAFTLENFRSVQNNDFNSSPSSVCPYDDDITYVNHTGDNNDCNDENIVASTQNGGFFSNLLMSVRNEVGPLFGGEYNYSQFGGDSSMDLAASIFCDFDNKKEIVDAPDGTVAETTSRP